MTTDIEIITNVHGCDVSKCKHYKNFKCLAEYFAIDNKIYSYNLCLRFPNCYYKQLMRGK